MKRILAVFLTLAMALNIAPVGALAAADSDAASIAVVEETDENASSQLDEETAKAVASDPFLQADRSARTEPEQDSQAKVDASDVSMEATDSFGRLLLADIDAEQTNGTSDGSNKITNVTVQGNTATVEYVAEELSNLVVAIYTDDTEQEMVASGQAAAYSCYNGQAKTVEVTLEGEIPAGFVVKAYLLDYYDYDPLCNAYMSNEYTSGMQELEKATVDDFDEARTINLDGDATTNFAVVNEGVELVKPEDTAPGENRVTMQDDQSLTYVIENASSRIMDLQPGSILVYPQDAGGLLIVKVKDISAAGTTVTITGDEDVDLSEVFAALKVEDTASTADFEYAQGSADGVTYAGMEAAPVDLGMENGKEVGRDDSVSKKLEVKKELGSLTITGGVYANLNFGIKVMLDGEQKYVTTYLDTSLTGTVTLTGKYNEAFELGELGYENMLIGVYAGIKPTLEVNADAYVEFTFTADKYNGFAYTFTGTDVRNGNAVDTSKPAECELYTEAHGTLYVGINLCPEVYALWKVVDITMDARVGITGDFKLLKADAEDPAKESLHTCDYCLTFTLTGSAELTVHMNVSLQVLFVKVESQWDKQLFTTNWNIGEAYYSVTHDEFGWGSCPYRTYRVKVSAGTDGAGAALSVTKSGSTVRSDTLDANGEYTMFLDPGSYTVKVTLDGKDSIKTITVGSSAQTVEFKVDNSSDTGKDDTGSDVSAASGTIGDNLTWNLDENGTLTISGTGPMKDYTYEDKERPWNRDAVKKIVIKKGITTVGSYVFLGLHNLTQVEIPEGVVSIGDDAFSMCESLEVMRFPQSLTKIGIAAFDFCEGLTQIEIPANVTEIGASAFSWCTGLKSVLLSSGVKKIAERTFGDCDALEEITIPEGVTSIGERAFDDCKNLQKVNLPESLISIESCAFQNCTKLTQVQLPDNLQSIKYWAFNGSGLTSVRIPKGMTTIDNGAFDGCDKLESVTMHDGLKEIGGSAFSGCDVLDNIIVPESVTSIGSFAFSGCANLKKIHLPSTLDKLEYSIFSGCKSLTEAEIPSAVKTIEDNAFKYCDGIKSVVIPNSVESIGSFVFEECDGLTDVYIPDSVKNMGGMVFYKCENLKNVRLSKSVEKILLGTFTGCKAMQSIEIPEGVKGFAMEVFYDCSNLKEIALPKSIEYIGEASFTGCDNLENVYYAGDETAWNKITIYSRNDALVNATIHYNSTSGGSFGGGGGGSRFSLDEAAQPLENSITTGTAEAKGSTYYATFDNAKAGKTYTIIVSSSKNLPLEAGSLIYINQITADANGTLEVPFITAADPARMKYVAACASDESQPDNPGSDDGKPSSGGGDGGGAAIILVGGVVAVAAVAGVVLMLPVEVSGNVKLADQPVANARVQVLQGDAVKAETVTDANGHFAVKVRRGSYTLRVQWTDAEGQPVMRTVDFKAPNANVNVAA